MHAAFRRGGRAAIDKVMKQQPAVFLKLLVLLVPREMRVEHTGGVKSMSDEELERGIEAVQVMLAARDAGSHAKIIEAAPEPVALPAPSHKPRRKLFQPAVRRGIDTIGEQSLGFVAFLTRVLQRNRWIDANGQRLLFSAKPVSQPPQFAAVGLDQQMKSTAIRELDWPIGTLGVTYPSVVEHVGIVPVGLVRYQQKYQQTGRIPTDRRASPRTGRRNKCR
jgi:hypothetical protein